MKKINVPRRDYRRVDREEPRRSGRGSLFGILGILCSLAVIFGTVASSLYQDSSHEGTEGMPPAPAAVPSPGGEGSLMRTSPVPRDREIPPVKILKEKGWPAPEFPSEPAAVPGEDVPPSPMPEPSPAPPPEMPAERPLPAARGVLALSQPGGAAPSAGGTGTRVRVIRGIEMVFVPGGEFMMGSGNGYLDEKPVHRVRVDDFYLGKFEVTQAQWQSVMRREPSRFGDCSDCPVEQVSWHHVRRFLSALSKSSGREFRLPTEAEWEYAARSGGEHLLWSGEPGNAEEYAWYMGNSRGKTHSVGKKRPNLFGLHDMSGNVSEWCSDWYDSTWYGISPLENPLGPEDVMSKQRVVRGGDWSTVRDKLKVTDRGALPADNRWDFLGFRVAMDASREGR